MSINNSSLTIETVKNCNIECLQSLLDNGKENIDVVDNYMRTPLHWAVCRNFEQGVALLLERGAKVNVRDWRQHTPLHLSCCVRSKNMISALLEKGAEINCVDECRRSPLIVAAIITFKEGIALMLTRGADVNTQDMAGCSPLHYATISRHLHTVKMLLNNGAKLNLKNNNGYTPLHIAAKLSQRCIVRLLLLYGAEVNAQDHSGSTPLHLIVHGLDDSQNDVVEDLLDWGASLIITDEDGNTPLSIVAKKWVPGDGLIKHLIKLQCVNLQLAYKASYTCSNYSLEGYKTLCSKELTKLKITRFCNQSVLDVFSKYEDPTFLSNVEMREAIYSSEFETEFPLYTVLLRAMFRHAEKRVSLMNAAQGVLIHVIDAHLPYEISRKIISYLSNDDIVNIITAENCV